MDSDYSDFDDDELKIIDHLAQVASEPLIITDIEDYEPPQGVLVPYATQHQIDIEVLRDLQTTSGK